MNKTFAKTIESIFSTKMMAILMIIYAIAMGYATFVENDYGTTASKVVIYNTIWFELIQIMLAINFIVNIKRYNLFKKGKRPILLFHIAFVIILLGAGVTRYISYEGLMPIREGKTSNLVISDKTYLSLRIDNNEVQKHYEKPLLLDTIVNNNFSETFKFKDKNINVSYVDFVPKAIETINTSKGNDNILHLITSTNHGRKEVYLKQGENINIGGVIFSYNAEVKNAIIITDTPEGLKIKGPFDISYMKMDNKESDIYGANTISKLEKRILYEVEGVRLVLKNTYKNSSLKFISNTENNATESDLLIVDVEVDNVKKRLNLFGSNNSVSPKNNISIEGLNIYIGYGAKYFELPFSLKLNDFVLEKYPGSNNPSSYSSQVTLIDGDKMEEHKIFMNNVLDYKGFRFFQSSYDRDERGTILSVSHDFWGTAITYLGYLLLTIGMFFTLFASDSRFVKLRKKLNKLKKTTTIVLIIAFASFSYNTQAQSPNEHIFNNVDSLIQVNNISKKHADKFGSLVIQDNGGRLKPIDTYASELLRKIYRKETYKNLNANQVLLSLMSNPIDWQFIPIIRIDTKVGLGKKINVTGKYARFFDFFDKNGDYKISDDVNTAYRKKPVDRGTYDKEILKVNEKVNLFHMAYSGDLLKLFPIPKDKNNTWISANDKLNNIPKDDSLFIAKIIPWYISTVKKAKISGDWTDANQKIEFISMYQKKYGASIIPSDMKIKYEILYNKYKPFQKLFPYYMILGFIMLILNFIQLFSTKKWVVYATKILITLIVAGFIVHTLGLSARWYISGHAPWSNGYESMIYISWATILAGFIFAKKSKISLSATAILTSLILMVSHLNWLDPEVTNLVPVLNSYWLMIHVAIITASYGFIGLAAILGFMVLFIYLSISNENKQKLMLTIKELTYINEMTLTIGLFMLTVGTFLGGVWANESWGRYWGWDPKETWAFVSIFVYAFVLHMRMIPALKGKYIFNLASVIAFSSIIMTYFGVNYYLSGMHSYASGDSVPIPTFIYYTIGIIVAVAIGAFINKKKYNL